MIQTHPKRQQGAALIIVLLLVTTLSLIAVGLTDQTVLAASRARNEQARIQLLWRSIGAETLAAQLLSEAIFARPDNVMSIDDPWAAQPFDLGALAVTENESGEIRFADAGRCFNINSLLVQPGTEQTDPIGDDAPSDAPPLVPLEERRILEFVEILSVLGISQNDATQLAIVIRDWIDQDGDPGPGGAEDNTYLRLPVPYRTGNTLITDETELRAMIGVDPVLMDAIAPFICALPTIAPAIINVNMLRPQDAPVLLGILGEGFTLSDAEQIIEQRPIGGYGQVEDVLTLSVLASAELTPDFASRITVQTEYIQAQMNLQFGKTLLRSTMLFRVEAGNRLDFVSRRFGSVR